MNYDGFLGFQDSLDFWTRKECWVSYISNVPMKEPGQISHKNIGMVVTFSTSSDLPFTSHMGISRGFTSILAHEPFPGDLSIAIHSFSAQIAKMVYQDKWYMITVPTQIMRSILAHKLSPGSFYVGDDYFYEKGLKSSLKSTSEEIKSFLEKHQLNSDELQTTYDKLSQQSSELTREMEKWASLFSCTDSSLVEDAQREYQACFDQRTECDHKRSLYKPVLQKQQSTLPFLTNLLTNYRAQKEKSAPPISFELQNRGLGGFFNLTLTHPKTGERRTIEKIDQNQKYSWFTKQKYMKPTFRMPYFTISLDALATESQFKKLS